MVGPSNHNLPNGYSVSHLNPHLFSFEGFLSSGRGFNFNVEVRYSNHCYSEKPLSSIDTTDALIPDGKHKRAFSLERYELSKTLPEHIRNLADKRVFLTHERNYVFLDMKEIHPDYKVFFSLRRHPGISLISNKPNLLLYVESAYIKTDKFFPKQKIQFKVLCQKVIEKKI